MAKACKLDDFDFVRFCFSDTNGIARSRMVPRRNVAKFMKNGVGFFEGVFSLSPDSEVTLTLPGRNGWPNSYAMADETTLHHLPWADNGGQRVGQMLCDIALLNKDTPVPQSPRTMAKKQLQRLHNMGFDLYSSFECEVMLYDLATNEPLVKTPGFMTSAQLSKVDHLWMEVDDMLNAALVDVESYHVEYGASQFEMPLAAQYGLRAADTMFVFRDGLKEMLYKKGVDAAFMTKPRTGHVCNGSHFNHSLWSLDTKKNAFASSDDPDGLSLICKQWVAGLVKHARALCALCCPTVNCYRRLHQPWAPCDATWGIDNRLAAFRVKAEASPYAENRLPSGSCNPYLVLAATIAAGIDGIETGATSSSMDAGADDLPHTLQEALDSLQEDTVLAGAMGEVFMRWFVPMKQELEIKRLPNSAVEVDEPEALADEATMYGSCL